MKKPMIVLSPQAMPMEDPFCGSYHYTNTFNTGAVVRAGGIPVLPAYLEKEDALELLTAADGLLLTGGADVSPRLYGEEPLDCCGRADPDRDRSDCNLLAAAWELKKPVLCICRGCQIANVWLGGTLYQDLPSQRPGEICHCQYDSYGVSQAHWVTVLQDTPLYRLLQQKKLPVNSLHHQAVRDLAQDLRPMALSPEGLVEAWYLPGEARWLRGIQWHPEMLENSPESGKIFREFLEACRKNREQ